MLAGCGDGPRDWKVSGGADGRVDAVAVEAAALACDDRASMTPACVRVAVALALRAVLRDVPLAVRVRGHVARVDSDVAAVLGKLGAQTGGHAVDAGSRISLYARSLAVKR
jgi:hypothetical protein